MLASSVTYFEVESESLVDLELLSLSLGDFELDPSVTTLQVLKLQVYAFLPVYVVLGIKPNVSCMLANTLPTELHP